MADSKEVREAKKQQKLKLEMERIEMLREFEKRYDYCEFVCGIDEVGRGPLAGPVVAGAVILPRGSRILYINDSKATNVNSTWYALESMKTNIVWIAGGKDKGNDYTPLYDLVKDKVRVLICMGVNNTRLHEEFGEMVDEIYDAGSAKEAVEIAYRCAKPGESVLLSPACASFDLFRNYEDRGKQFKEAVASL